VGPWWSFGNHLFCFSEYMFPFSSFHLVWVFVHKHRCVQARGADDPCRFESFFCARALGASSTLEPWWCLDGGGGVSNSSSTTTRESSDCTFLHHFFLVQNEYFDMYWEDLRMQRAQNQFWEHCEHISFPAIILRPLLHHVCCSSRRSADQTLVAGVVGAIPYRGQSHSHSLSFGPW